MKQIVIIRGISLFASYVQNTLQNPAVKVNSICGGNYWGSSVWISSQQINYLSCFLHSSNTSENIGTERSCASAAYRIKKACDSIRREVVYNIMIELGIPTKLVRLTKLCLNETCSRVWVSKNLSDVFPIRSGLKQRDVLSPLLFNFALENAIRSVQ